MPSAFGPGPSLLTPRVRRVHEQNAAAGEARMARFKADQKRKDDHNWGRHDRLPNPFCAYCDLSAQADRNEAVGVLSEAVAGIWSKPPAPRGFRKAKGDGR